MDGKWRRTLIVGFVLVATHAASALYYAHRYASGVIRTPTRAMTLDLTFDEWADATNGDDSTVYLRVAEHVANNKGLIWQVPSSKPPRFEPFIFWGPGAPVVFGWWLKFVGGRTMFTFFMFAAIAQLAAGALTVATTAQWTCSTVALSLVAVFSGFCPPLQGWFYGVHLTSSEIVALPMLALVFFSLNKAFQAWAAGGGSGEPQDSSPSTGIAAGGRRSEGSLGRHAPYAVAGRTARLRAIWRCIVPVGLSRSAWMWFGLTGILIGGSSLARDCIRVFAWFVAIFVVSRAAVGDRRRIKAALAVAVLLVAGEYAVRYPVQLWNKHRAGRSTICQTSDGCIWRYGIWAEHDQFDWYESVGLGFGDYLDPEAGRRVRAYFDAGQPWPALYSFEQLLQAVAKRPIAAVAFKVSRLPMLWLDTDMWPRSEVCLQSLWCVAIYMMLAIFVAMQVRRRRRIPEILYLYLTLVVCASPLIHFEFRYTFPVWNTLVLVPGLLVASLSRDGLPHSRGNRRSIESTTPEANTPSGITLAA
ncbi:MAG TPA: hypothetical protein VHX65_18625 [Pirellulales bacterium]|jgi:hypothetical protein|nr:hypothetical protein [Pirellulales bacterium]